MQKLDFLQKRLRRHYDELIGLIKHREEILSMYYEVFQQLDLLESEIAKKSEHIKGTVNEHIGLFKRGKTIIFDDPVPVFVMRAFSQQIDLESLDEEAYSLLEKKGVISHEVKVDKARLKKEHKELYEEHTAPALHMQYVACSAANVKFLGGKNGPKGKKEGSKDSKGKAGKKRRPRKKVER